VNTAEKPENTVVDEYQKGYQIHDRILRAAMVTVATASSETPEPSEASSQKPEGRPATGSQDTPGENPNP
ncbi:MAG: nucleotide exchange factor GrpE, partial [Nitrospirales bacterium]